MPTVQEGIYEDEKLDFDLYLVNTSLENIRPLIFKRLLPSEFPLRQTIGNRATHELVFSNLVQIEAYLMSHGLAKTTEETNVIS
jgi:hypothetical protein